MFMPKRILEKKLRRFLKEDIGQGDITTFATIPPNTIAEAKIVAKEDGLMAGIEETMILCESLGLQCKASILDGHRVKPNDIVLHIMGDARTILSAERTLLNLLSRMSGIATATKHMVDKIKDHGYDTRVAATRKVAPGLGYFDKKAVYLGKGDPHRSGLNDLMLIKDNHIRIVGSVRNATKLARNATSFTKKIEVEVTSLKEAFEAAESGADIIMLDNFSVAKVRDTIRELTKKGFRSKMIVEVSGGITEDNILEYAGTNVDIVSIGVITHSVASLDMSLEITKTISS